MLLGSLRRNMEHNIPTMQQTIDSNNNSNQNIVLHAQNIGPNSFSSPVIPRIQSYGGVFTSIPYIKVNHNNNNTNNAQQRIDNTHWICDYSLDIFQTLKETELKRRMICFRSQQGACRLMLLNLIKEACEKHKLNRTTLHFAVYMLDCFMDTYTIRADKLNLTAITCLILSAKIEEADVDMPKFAELCKLVNNAYTLNEFKSVELRVLDTFKFALIRPTAATFAEYFSNSLVTLEDFHIFVNHWYNEMLMKSYQQQQLQQPQQEFTQNAELPRGYYFSPPQCPFKTYDDMLTTINKTYFELIDVTLDYIKFSNARPSIIASACIAAARQLYGIFPIWTPYLIKLTSYTAEVIVPFIDAILDLYRSQYNYTQYQSVIVQTPNTPMANGNPNNSVLCDSPDSGIASVDNNTTSKRTDCAESDEDFNEDNDVDTQDEDEPYHCFEYPLLSKRRRVF